MPTAYFATLSALWCLKGNPSPIDEPQTRHMGRFLGVCFFLSETGTSLGLVTQGTLAI